MMTFAWIVLLVLALLILSYQRASLIVSTVGIGVFLLAMSILGPFGPVGLTIFWLVFLVIALPLNLVPIRRQLLSSRIFIIYRKLLPTMSDTEQQALQAGTVWWNKDLFSGMPDWKKLHKMPAATLSDEEQAFLDGPVEQLCEMIDAWAIRKSMSVPKEIWDHLKQNGYFGMIIPKRYGGKEFSATMHSEVIVKVSGVSSAVATIISVPNSLGPAELLLQYGTDEQKNHYLPRLAKGEDIPCFALTSPVAGSDASAIVDNGVICKREHNGKQITGILLNWDKRYITLSPVATILGLAFKLYDPDHLLGDKEELGITCALIPTNTKGIMAGNRHYPLDAAFPNGPTQGKDVFIPIDWVIGGKKMIGQGWRMLMECLAAGRSISLPSMVTGGAKRAVLASGAYARIRRQFNTYIANFGGVEEVLTRIVANTYLMEAMRLFTLSALDQGEKPAVASAMCKYHATELARQVVNDAMDVHGGKGICMGPNNYLAQAYIELPISITVEGANILTRSMIIFGQGAIRCHPFVLREMHAAQESDKAKGLREFDQAIFGHIGFIISNIVRSFWLSLTNGRLSRAPRSPLHKYYQYLTRFSASFALVADVCMIAMGGKLKRLEKLSGRLGDVLSNLYICSAIIKHYEVGLKQYPNGEDMILAKWIIRERLVMLQVALDNLLLNLPMRWLGRVLRIFVMPWGKNIKSLRDHLGAKVAKLVLEPSSVRERFAKNVYCAPNSNNLVGRMEEILSQVIEVEPILKKLNKAYRSGTIKGNSIWDLAKAAVDAEVLAQHESDLLVEVEKARMSVINVDDFSPQQFDDISVFKE